MRLSYNDVFKYSDRLNPISSKTLFLAGKLAELHSKKNILDLGSGKGYPSLLWASVFGVNVEGFDLNKSFVEYANSCARLLNLLDRVRYVYGDVRELRFIHKYDVVSSLGLGVAEVYGAISTAVKNFRRMLRNGRFLILEEPVWLVESVPQAVHPELATECQEVIDGFEAEYQAAKRYWDIVLWVARTH